MENVVRVNVKLHMQRIIKLITALRQSGDVAGNRTGVGVRTIPTS